MDSWHAQNLRKSGPDVHPEHPFIAGALVECLADCMEIRNREQQVPFTTKDGSTIRSLLDLSNAPVIGQSLAEASLPPDQ
jgi:hypothetical protein